MIVLFFSDIYRTTSIFTFSEPTTVPSNSCTGLCDEIEESPKLETPVVTEISKPVKKKSSQVSIKSKKSALSVKSKKSTKSVQKVKSMASRKSLTTQRKLSVKKSINLKLSQKSVGEKSSKELSVKSLHSKGL